MDRLEGEMDELRREESFKGGDGSVVVETLRPSSTRGPILPTTTKSREVTSNSREKCPEFNQRFFTDVYGAVCEDIP